MFRFFSSFYSKQTALNLAQIPTNLSTEIQVLMLNDNNIQTLNREEFTTLGLINLQKIYLKKSNIRYLHRETFKSLTILVELDLSENLIESIEKQTFAGNDRLRILYLYGNPIKMLIADQFPRLPHLRTLDLHACNINFVDETAFSNVDLLEYMNLNSNKLESLPGNLFSHMKNLKTLLLEENPWKCDCKLKKFRNWYVINNLNRISLQCKTPHSMAGQNWETIDQDMFGCPPTLKILKEDVQMGDLESNVTFKCYTVGDPRPTITWELDGKEIENDNVIIDNDDSPAASLAASSITNSHSVEQQLGNKVWSNLSIYNISSLNAGYYTCFAKNDVGYASQNISLVLPEIVDHVLIRNSDTFWYFGLILGVFGTVISFLLIAISFCLCRKLTRNQRSRKSNIKHSVSFNDQEKKLLDLSITTTNDRQDYSDLNTPSTTTTTTGATSKTDTSIIALEPVQITIENFHHPHRLSHLDLEHHQRLSDEFPLNISLFPPPPPEFCGAGSLMTTNSGQLLAQQSTQQSLQNQSQHSQQMPSMNSVTKPPYGNIFISVSVSQDAMENELNMYPDLLNIPKNRVKNSFTSNNLQTSQSSSIVPINIIESYATLPRNKLLSSSPSTSTSSIASSQKKAPVSILKQTSKNYDRCIIEENCLPGLINANEMNTCISCNLNNQPYDNIDNMGKRVTASGVQGQDSDDPQERELEQQPTNIHHVALQQQISSASSSPIPPSQLSTALLMPNGNDFVSL